MAALIAGGWRGGAPLHETDDETWAAMMTQNLETVRAALTAMLPSMIAAKRGSIVAVGSRAIERPWTSTNAAAYATSKAAVGALCQTVAAEVLEHGVRVNVVMPSTMDTPANRSAMPNSDPTQWVSLPSAAGVVAFFLSDAAKDISGALIPLYGRA
jgi:NAD(P)-dependent dehydrogenase (short-subunit alcohol dehydrogenase family)